jgi:hypothetical protein
MPCDALPSVLNGHGRYEAPIVWSCDNLRHLTVACILKTKRHRTYVETYFRLVFQHEITQWIEWNEIREQALHSVIPCSKTGRKCYTTCVLCTPSFEDDPEVAFPSTWYPHKNNLSIHSPERMLPNSFPCLILTTLLVYNIPVTSPVHLNPDSLSATVSHCQYFMEVERGNPSGESFAWVLTPQAVVLNLTGQCLLQ